MYELDFINMQGSKRISRMKVLMAIPTALILLAGNFAYAQVSDTTPPSAPTSLSATASGSGQIGLSWGGSTDNVGVAGYYLYRNGAQIANTSATSYTDSGLSPALYVYTVTAYDAAGNVSPQSSSALATATLDTTPPSVPSGLSATTGYHPPQITLSWTASTDNIGVVGYYIYKNGIRIRTDIAIAVTSYADTDILASIDYSYTVMAYDQAGNLSNKSSPLTVTIVIDNAPPSTPLGLTALATSSSAIVISWAPSYDNVGVVGYDISRNGVQIADIASTSIPYVDSGLSPGMYTYTVAAYDLAHNISLQSFPASAAIVLDTVSPSAPTALSATAVSAAETHLLWNASTDNVGVMGYDVYRNGTQIAAISKNSYSDTGLVASTTYLYAVAAYDLSGNISSSSAPASATTLSANSVQSPQTNGTVGSSVIVIAPTSTTPAVIFTLSLYRGLRNNQVQLLQHILIQEGYLGATSNTGYFGGLTEQAVQRFQCDHNIVCSGSLGSTGWGSVGAKTRTALNNLSGNASPGVSSTAQLTAQIQALQTLLMKLKLQIPSHEK